MKQCGWCGDNMDDEQEFCGKDCEDSYKSETEAANDQDENWY